MNTSHRPQLLIYCDGGFGNRLNALFSGLALAQALQLPHTVFWPRNNWCQAGYTEIFLPGAVVDERTLGTLAGTLDGCVPLLHDTLASDVLKIPFESAYAYASIDDFTQRAVATGRDLFFYPAVMPAWIPRDLVTEQMRACIFQPAISNAVTGYIQQSIGQPFYGLHLRRTDLGVGYSDEEVREIVQSHPKDKFFVCSDDPVAESLAAVYPNVVRREKQAYVEKRNGGGNWTAATADDDGRVYHSNIDRTATSVLEAVIDLLILAHSEIVGFSGSTFQNIARLYGQHAPMIALDRPDNEINYVAKNTLVRQMHSGALTPTASVGVFSELYDGGRRDAAIELEAAALEVFKHQGMDDSGIFILHYNLAAHLLNVGQPYRAKLYLEAASRMMPSHAPTRQLLELASARTGNNPALAPVEE